MGLTATPRDYFKNFNKSDNGPKDPRQTERWTLLDTHRTFECPDGQPTFRYSLLDGVRDGFLINPTVVDARSKVTTKLLSKEVAEAIAFEHRPHYMLMQRRLQQDGRIR